MKKIIMLVVCLTMMGIQSVKAQSAIAALHHEGKVSLYSIVQSAIDNAEQGDTIYLSQGTFGGFSVDKGVHIIGPGVASVNIIGDVTVYWGDGVSFSNIDFSNNLQFPSGVINNIKIKQCRINGSCIFGSNAAVTQSFSSIEILMCHIVGWLEPGSSLTGMTVVNSVVGSVRGGGQEMGSVTFVNCNIGGLWDSRLGNNSYLNCIISTLNLGNFVHCLYNDIDDDIDGTPIIDECYEGNFEFDTELNCSLTDEELKANGYLGIDGSVVGITGGATPYTLESPLLQVTDYKLDVDNTERKLKVTLKLGNK